MPSVFPTAATSAITDKVIPELKQYGSSAAGRVYRFVWLDAIHYKSPGGWSLPEQGRHHHGAGAESGRQKVLGLYRRKVEGANFWLSVLVTCKTVS